MSDYQFNDKSFQKFQKNFNSNAKNYQDFANNLCEKAKSILSNDEHSKRLFDISNKFELYFFQDHILNWNEIENILAFHIISDYSNFAIFKEEKAYSNLEDLNSFCFFLTLKYQFLTMKCENHKIIDLLMSSFTENQSKRAFNCKSNMIASFFVKYLCKNPRDMDMHSFDLVAGDLMCQIDPENDQFNGKKIEWPLKFLQLLEKFMNSKVCYNYIRSVDLLERNRATKKYNLKKICSDEEYQEHCRILIYEHLRQKSYLYFGKSQKLARNIYNGSIIFNEKHNFSKHYNNLDGKNSQAYLMILCTHELLHLKRIIFAQGGVYQWGTPNMSPFNQNLKTFPNECYPEIGDSFELKVLGFEINEKITKDEKSCLRILNQALWNKKNGIKCVSREKK